MSGECEVGCWRNGIGDIRLGGVGVGLPPDCEFEFCEWGGKMRWDMLPIRERLLSEASSGTGLKGRLVPSGGDLRGVDCM